MRVGVVVVAALGAFVFFMLVVGSLGGARPELRRVAVGEVLEEPSPADRYGDEELQIVGWYAALDADCVGDDGGSDASIAWLQADCPLHVLLTDQPGADVTQAELERAGLRMAAPIGQPFPSRAEPGGANLRLQQLVFFGHFDDAAAGECVPERVERCQNTFVVDDYDGYVR